MFRIGKTFAFAAAHHLPGLPEGHKCARPHGHTWGVEVVVQDAGLRGPGFVTDFGDLRPLGEYIAARLDHRDLNEVLEFPPTSERIARHLAEWFIANVEPVIGGRLVSVKVSEGRASWASYSPGHEAVS
ncbi:MAG TPA: 6-carboxytetrahydropterin synthase [Streptosporangiaceae bacterium]|nr:6-carboxytetrahydropterin synthase [Streptosporangiaceae bacterium]